MEKTADIRHGKTPPEKPPTAGQKQAASTSPLKQLEQDPTKRLAESVAQQPSGGLGEVLQSTVVGVEVATNDNNWMDNDIFQLFGSMSSSSPPWRATNCPTACRNSSPAA